MPKGIYFRVTQVRVERWCAQHWASKHSAVFIRRSAVHCHRIWVAIKCQHRRTGEERKSEDRCQVAINQSFSLLRQIVSSKLEWQQTWSCDISSMWRYSFQQRGKEWCTTFTCFLFDLPHLLISIRRDLSSKKRCTYLVKLNDTSKPHQAQKS